MFIDLCVHRKAVCIRTLKPLLFPLKGVAEGADALLPEAGGDWRTCRLCPERRRHQVSNIVFCAFNPNADTRSDWITDINYDTLEHSLQYMSLYFPGMLISGCRRWSNRRYLQDGGMLRQTAHCLLVYTNMVGFLYGSFEIGLRIFLLQLPQITIFFCCHLTVLTCFLWPGYEMYTTMRADPCLCFLERAGRPDDKAIDAEQHTGDAELGDEWVTLANGAYLNLLMNL